VADLLFLLSREAFVNEFVWIRSNLKHSAMVVTMVTFFVAPMGSHELLGDKRSALKQAWNRGKTGEDFGTVTDAKTPLIPAISAASIQLSFFAIAFKITSCSFIIRSVSRAGIAWLDSTLASSTRPTRSDNSRVN